jgi:hypothetical protein
MKYFAAPKSNSIKMQAIQSAYGLNGLGATYVVIEQMADTECDPSELTIEIVRRWTGLRNKTLQGGLFTMILDLVFGEFQPKEFAFSQKESEKKPEESEKKPEESEKKPEESEKKLEESEKKLEESEKKLEESEKKLEENRFPPPLNPRGSTRGFIIKSNSIDLDLDINKLKKKKYKKEKEKIASDAFAKFWASTHRRGSRMLAVNSWNRFGLDTELELVVEAYADQAKAYDWTGDKFTPHVATWLNQQRWLDAAPAVQAKKCLKLPSGEDFSKWERPDDT